MWHHLSIKNKHSQRAALILQKYTLSKGCPLIIFRMVLIARGKERKLVVEIYAFFFFFFLMILGQLFR